MRLAIIGSRGLILENISDYIPEGVCEIISGGAKGIDRCAEKYAKEKGIKMTVILPDYRRYKRGAPLVRNKEIIMAADEVIAFWDTASRGTRSAIELCRRLNKKVTVYTFSSDV